MGMFKGKTYFPGPRPRPSTAPPAVDETMTDYVVNGMFDGEGNYYVPEVLVVELSGGRATRRPGDVVSLTRSEASVLMKRTSLTPVAPR